MHAIRICPLDVDKSLLHCPSNNCIFPYKIVKTLINVTKFDFIRKVLFELLENSRPRPAIFSGTPRNFEALFVHLIESLQVWLF